MAKFAHLGLCESLEEALQAADHLTLSDAAAVATARTLAAKIETLDDPSKLMYAAQVYLSALKGLNLDPASRMAAAISSEDTRSRVADMKAERERRRRQSA